MQSRTLLVGGGKKSAHSDSIVVHSASHVNLNAEYVPLVVCIQVNVPSLQSRFDHSAAAFSLSPGLTEVTIFGGCPEYPSNFKSYADLPQVANTTVLRFGESPHVVCALETSVLRTPVFTWP